MVFKKRLAILLAAALGVLALGTTPAHAYVPLQMHGIYTFTGAGCVMNVQAGNYGKDAYANIRMQTPGCWGWVRVTAYLNGRYKSAQTGSQDNTWKTAAVYGWSIVCVDYTNFGPNGHTASGEMCI